MAMNKRWRERFEALPAEVKVRYARWVGGVLLAGIVGCLVGALSLSLGQPGGAGSAPTAEPTPDVAALMAQAEQLRLERDEAQRAAGDDRRKYEEELAINEALRADLRKATAQLRHEKK
jgi:hypothetical protein